MKRVVRVVARDGATHEVAMGAEEAAFFVRLAELEAQNDPTITFHDVVAAWLERQRREREERGTTSNLVN